MRRKVTPNSALLRDVAPGQLEDIPWMRRQLLRWGHVHFRSFPWRSDRDPYRTLVTEILLKQTRADQVRPVRETFLKRYPVPGSLAAADPADLSSLVRTLGFADQRVPQLSALGRALSKRGRLPRDLAGLLALPGVGAYTASAVACFAFGRREPALDVNVARIIGRVFGIAPERGELRKNAVIIAIAAAIVRCRRPREINWALLDLGAEICRPNPRCSACPLSRRCEYYQRNQAVSLHSNLSVEKPEAVKPA
jgi:A/G-specific adenine glycosylase